jgi:hypothetical protein
LTLQPSVAIATVVISLFNRLEKYEESISPLGRRDQRG